MDDQLGGDQDRKSDQEARMDLYVAKERQPAGDARRSTNRGKKRERQPRKARDDENSAMYEFQMVSLEVRFAKKLEDRTA